MKEPLTKELDEHDHIDGMSTHLLLCFAVVALAIVELAVVVVVAAADAVEMMQQRLLPAVLCL